MEDKEEEEHQESGRGGEEERRSGPFTATSKSIWLPTEVFAERG